MMLFRRTIAVSLLLFVLFPAFSFAQNQQTLEGIQKQASEALKLDLGKGGEKSLVPCGNPGQPPCNECDFIVLINRASNFLLVYIMIPLSIIMLMYAGARLAFAFGNPGWITHGKKVLTNTIIGFLIAFGGVFLVDALVKGISTQDGFLKNLGPWQQPVCKPPEKQFGKFEGVPVPTSPPAAERGAPGTPAAAPGTLSREQALSIFKDSGIILNNQNECVAGQTSECTSLTGLRVDTVSQVVALKNSCGCQIIVTGGTEGGHAGGLISHANGYKLDLRPSPELNSYIERNFTKLKERRSDGAEQWKDAKTGVIYAREFNHWDVVYPPS